MCQGFLKVRKKEISAELKLLNALEPGGFAVTLLVGIYVINTITVILGEVVAAWVRKSAGKIMPLVYQNRDCRKLVID